MDKVRWSKCSKCGKRAASYKAVIVCNGCRRKARTHECALKGCTNTFDGRRNKQRYCSQACANLGKHKEYLPKVCAFCSCEFEVTGWELADRQTCGRFECRIGYQTFLVHGWSPAALMYRAAVEETIQAEKRRKWAVEVIERQRRMIARNNGLI